MSAEGADVGVGAVAAVLAAVNDGGDDEDEDEAEDEPAHAAPVSPSTVIPPIRKKARRPVSASSGLSEERADDDIGMADIKHPHDRESISSC